MHPSCIVDTFFHILIYLHLVDSIILFIQRMAYCFDFGVDDDF